MGLQLLLTHSLLADAHREAVSKVSLVISKTFERALFETGTHPIMCSLIVEDDIAMKAKSLLATMNAYQGASLEDYAGKIFSDAEKFYNQVQVWETKSLWGYIKHWAQRKIKQLKKG